jgi:drug/metabolite transporter (DMT)-like permease
MAVPPTRPAAPAPVPAAPPGAPSTAPATMARPPTVDFVLLGVAVMAVSTSAPLIRAAEAPSLAVAFWRTLLAVPVVGLFVLAGGWRRQLAGLADRPARRAALVAGVLLAAHFAVWVPSVELTSVASATTLVATQPIWAALLARWRGELVPRRAWYGIGVAMVGAVLLTGVDFSISGRALVGDLMALVGGMLAAAYVTIGADARRALPTSAYALVCYAVASVVLLAVCLVGGQSLGGYDGETWLVLGALTLGPQLLGHTLINRVLGTTSATLVSVAILFEIVGAGLLAWVFFEEVPPLSVLPAAALIAGGLVLVARSGATAPITEAEAELAE